MASTRETMFATLATALSNINRDDGYQTTIQKATRIDPSMTDQMKFQMPMVLIDDPGEDYVQKRDATNVRFRTPIQLAGMVQDSDGDRALVAMEDMAATLLKFLDSSPSLGAAVYKIRSVNRAPDELDSEAWIGVVRINTEIIWVATRGTY